MKNILLFALSLFLITSCGNNKSDSSNTNTDSSSTGTNGAEKPINTSSLSGSVPTNDSVHISEQGTGLKADSALHSGSDANLSGSGVGGAGGTGTGNADNNTHHSGTKNGKDSLK